MWTVASGKSACYSWSPVEAVRSSGSSWHRWRPDAENSSVGHEVVARLDLLGNLPLSARYCVHRRRYHALLCCTGQTQGMPSAGARWNTSEMTSLYLSFYLEQGVCFDRAGFLLLPLSLVLAIHLFIHPVGEE